MRRWSARSSRWECEQHLPRSKVTNILLFFLMQAGYTACDLRILCRVLEEQEVFMNVFKSLAVSGLVSVLGLIATPALSAPTKYPLTLDNCGAKVTIARAP